MEAKRFLRITQTPQEVANGFVAYCRHRRVLTRGMCRVGYVRRRPPPAPSGAQVPGVTAASQYTLRGLIANKDIPKDENVVMLSEFACVHPGTALRCKPFMDIIPNDVRQQCFQTEDFVRNSRLSDRSLIRHNQLLMALYMTYLTLLRALRPQELSSTSSADVVQYLDFMPRSEGAFDQLEPHLNGWLAGAQVSRVTENSLATHFGVTVEEVRAVVVYFLCMLYSRVCPMDSKELVRFAFQRTPLEAAVQKVCAGKPEDRLVQEPISFLCPMIDLCNHSDSENVAVMSPERDPSASGPIICLRSLRDIAKGEELTMTYGGSPTELRVIWGMKEVLL